jgi:CHRD domain
MRTRSLLIAAGAAALAACATGPESPRADLAATLTGLQEVPGPGDGDGTGTAEMRVESAEGRLCWDLYVRQIDAATAAHIHRGMAGQSGPPVVTLTTPGPDGHSEGCIAVDPMLGREIAVESHLFYVNVHTAAFPAGAVRGQLRGGPNPRTRMRPTRR